MSSPEVDASPAVVVDAAPVIDAVDTEPVFVDAEPVVDDAPVVDAAPVVDDAAPVVDDAAPVEVAPTPIPEPAPEPTPEPAPEPPSSKTTPPPSKIPAAVVKSAAAHADAFVLRLSKCLETPAGIDAVLAFVCYTARLGGVVLKTTAGRALLHTPVYRLAVLIASASRPASLRSIYVMQPASASLKTDAAAAALVLAKRLGALGSLLTEARMMLRLWGLLPLYVWARSLVKQLRKKDTEDAEDEKETSKLSRTTTCLAWTQLLSCIAYQAAENYAYLSSKGVLGASPAKQASLYLWSSRSFAVYVAVELARGAYDIVHHGASDTPAKRAAAVELHRNFARYAAFAPAMGHWSMEKGFLGEASLAVFGFIPAALQIHKIWGQ